MSDTPSALLCGFRWTTGTGPDDPDDTGIHVCARTHQSMQGWDTTAAAVKTCAA